MESGQLVIAGHSGQGLVGPYGFDLELISQTRERNACMSAQTDEPEHFIRIVAYIDRIYGPEAWKRNRQAPDTLPYIPLGFQCDVTVQVEMRRGEQRVLTEIQKYGDGTWHETFEKAQQFLLFKTGVWIEQRPENGPAFQPALDNWREGVGCYVREFQPNDKPRRFVEIDGELYGRDDNLWSIPCRPANTKPLVVVGGKDATSWGYYRPKSAKQTSVEEDYDDDYDKFPVRIKPSNQYGEVRQFFRIQNYITRFYGWGKLLEKARTLPGEQALLDYREDFYIQVEARQGKERMIKTVNYSRGEWISFEEIQADVLESMGIWMEQLPDLPPPSAERAGPSGDETVAYYVREFEPNDTPRALVEIRGDLPRRNEALIPDVMFGNRRLVQMRAEYLGDEVYW